MIRTIILLSSVTSVLSGCASTPDISYLNSNSPNIRNGIAIDHAEIPFEQFDRVVLPENAGFERVRLSARCSLEMEKRLTIMGHPPEMISINELRTQMGCAFMLEGKTLVIGTFGEYDVEGHGGARIKLTVRLPDVVVVERRKELSGSKSLPNYIFGPRSQNAIAALRQKRGKDKEGHEWQSLVGESRLHE